MECRERIRGLADWQYLTYTLCSSRTDKEAWMEDRSLSRLIELAKGVHMNAQQPDAQRNSFVYGNTKIENSNVTRELVEEISQRVPSRTDHG